MDYRLKRLLYLRFFFLIPWIAVTIQILLINMNVHRFTSLGITNKILALIYLLFFLLLISLDKFKLKRIQIGEFLLLILTLFSIISLLYNKPSDVVADYILLLLQFLFFYIGLKNYTSFINEKMIKTILYDNLIISILFGFYIFYQSLEIVTPLFGILILSAIASLKFKKKKFLYYFLIYLIMYNTLYAFGKQNLLFSIVLLFFLYFIPLKNKNHKFNLNKFLKKIFYLIITLLLLIILFYLLFEYGQNINSIHKLNLFFKSFKEGATIEALLNNPILAYEFFDLSTAGRVSEIFIAINSLIKDDALIFGGGLGYLLDFSSRDAITTFFSFGETRSVQTLPVFIFVRFGLIGLILSIIILIYLWFKYFKSNLWWRSFFAILFLSSLAFSAVFKFHYLFFFMAIAIGTSSKKFKLKGDL